MKSTCVFTAAAVHCALLVSAQPLLSPQQIYTAYGEDPTSTLTMSWASATACTPAAQFGTSPATLADVPAAALTVEPPFVFQNAAGLQYYYRAHLAALTAGSRVYYRVGCTDGGAANYAWSTINSVTLLAAPGSGAPPPVVLLWGDMGRDGGEQTLPALVAEAQAAAAGAPGAATFAIIAGDFAYDMGDEDGLRGANFMQRVSNITAFLPTMVTIGNHEQASGNATPYTNILGRAMPGPALGHWYSFDAGLVHFVMLSSEVYHMDAFVAGGAGGVEVSAPAQKAWLQQDLAAVNRSATPWLVAVYHRPFYCSNADSDECSSVPLQWPTNPLRVDLEPLFMAAGVDLCVEAHEHSVEIIYPLANGTVTAKSFESPAAPVHWVTGAAGCNEDSGVCYNPILLPSAFTHAYLWGPEQYSFTRLVALNATVLHLEQVKVYPNVGVWAAIDIVQPRHGPFPLLPVLSSL